MKNARKAAAGNVKCARPLPRAKDEYRFISVNLRSSSRRPAHGARADVRATRAPTRPAAGAAKPGKLGKPGKPGKLAKARPAPLRTRLREAASDAILDAAEAVASEHGLEAASCAAIAKRAGVAVGTLYNYFPDREGILTALFASRREALIPRILDAAYAHCDKPFEPRLRGFVKDVMTAYEESRPFLRLALDADRVMPKVKDPRATATLLTAFTDSLEAIFRDAAAHGRFPKGHETVYARMIQGSLKSLTIWHIEQGRRLTDDIDLVLDAFMRGLGDPE